MKLMPATLLAAVLVIVATGQANAASSGKKSKASSGQSGAGLQASPDRFGWYPRDANQLRFGSAIWFEQMEREGRIGGNRRTGR